jgi:hypothetical protein
VSQYKAPLRFAIREIKDWEPELRGGRIVYGGKSREVTRQVRILQYWDDDVRHWIDVPEVHANETTNHQSSSESNP